MTVVEKVGIIYLEVIGIESPLVLSKDYIFVGIASNFRRLGCYFFLCLSM